MGISQSRVRGVEEKAREEDCEEVGVRVRDRRADVRPEVVC